MAVIPTSSDHLTSVCLPPPQGVKESSDEAKSFLDLACAAPAANSPVGGASNPSTAASGTPTTSPIDMHGIAGTVSSDSETEATTASHTDAHVVQVGAPIVHRPSAPNITSTVIAPSASSNDMSPTTAKADSATAPVGIHHPPPVFNHQASGGMVHTTGLSKTNVDRIMTKHIQGIFQGVHSSCSTAVVVAETVFEAKKRKSVDALSSKSQKASKKAKELPNAPMHNSSAYLLFSAEARVEVKASQPDLTLGAITKVVATKWKALSDGERAVWCDKAFIEKERYEQELAAYNDSGLAAEWQTLIVKEENKNPSFGSTDAKKKRMKSKMKDPNAPKRNSSAYIHYSAEARVDVKASQPDLTLGAITKVVATKWKALSDGERAVWDKKAVVDKERYEQELAAYNDSGLAAEWQTLIVKEENKNPSFGSTDAKKKRMKSKMKDPNAPKRNSSAYIHYSAEARVDVKASQPDLTLGAITKVVATKWKALSDGERAVWDKKAVVDKERYEQELAVYKDSGLAAKWQTRIVEEENELCQQELTAKNEIQRKMDLNVNAASNEDETRLFTVPPGKLGATVRIDEVFGAGATITDIDPDCTLKGKLTVGDRIVTIDGHKVTSIADFNMTEDETRKFGIAKAFDLSDLNKRKKSVDM